MIRFAKSFAAVCAIAALSSSAATSASADPVEIILNNFLPPNFPIFREVISVWAEEVNAASNGTLHITIPTNSMAPFPRLWDVVQDRVADMGIVPLGTNDQNITLSTLLDIPMIGNDSSAITARALWDTYEAYFADAGEYEAQGLMPLTFFVIGGNQFFSRERRIETLADFAGLKIRGEGVNPLQMMTELGAAPVGAPGVQSFELLSNGVIDVSMNPFGPAMSLGLVGHAPEITTLPGGFFRPGFAIVINQEAFDELPADAQRALVETSGADLAERIGIVDDRTNEAGRQAFLDAGSTITPASDTLIAAVRERTAFVEQAWLENASRLGVAGPAALAFFRSEVAGQ